MSESFSEFVQAELQEIMNSMDERCRKDPELCCRVAMEWIEKNAKMFREEWNKKNLQRA